jgi:hypothetical protein
VNFSLKLRCLTDITMVLGKFRLTERKNTYETILKKGEQVAPENLWNDDLNTERDTQSLQARSGLMLVAMKPIH